MLKLKPQGDPIEYGNIKKFEGVDGPPQAYAETRNGERYVYSTYALAVKEVDRTTAEIGLWSAIHNTLRDLLRCRIQDPVILWRSRPAFSEYSDFPEDPKRYQIIMRCVIVPRDEKFLPVL